MGGLCLAKAPYAAENLAFRPTAQSPWTESNDDPMPRDDVTRMARNAGLLLTDTQFLQVLDAAPYVRAHIERLRRACPYADEPASVFLSPPR